MHKKNDWQKQGCDSPENYGIIFLQLEYFSWPHFQILPDIHSYILYKPASKPVIHNTLFGKFYLQIKRTKQSNVNDGFESWFVHWKRTVN